jgi:CheY-like chemotaxis protein
MNASLLDPIDSAEMPPPSESIQALEQRIEFLEEADRRKDEFLAILAHELRNPLASIANAVSVLRRAESEEDQVWATGVLTRQSEHLTRLIDDLLDVSRITSGKIELRTEILDLAPVLDGAVETARPTIAGHEHALVTAYSRGQLWVEGDPARLKQIVLNLLTNAAKYTPNGGRIHLTAAEEDEMIVVKVQDNGIGILPRKLPEVFGLFTQADRAAGRSEGGLGIGLAIVKKLVELHGGRVSVRSPGAGQGSEFIVGLPIAVAPVYGPGRAAGPGSGPQVRLRAKVLVVDDLADSAEGLARLLKRRGHEVVQAGDGPTALEFARAFLPDVILLDVGLPGMDGCEVARRLRQEPIFRSCLLFAITGFGREEDRRRCVAAGFDDHFAKPIAFDDLETRIQNALWSQPME